MIADYHRFQKGDPARGVWLRQNGVTSDQLKQWEEAERKGDLQGHGRRRGRKANPLTGEVTELRLQVKRLSADLERAKAVIEVQKKVSQILGVSLPQILGDETP
jgi:ribosomal protein L19E